MASFKQFVVLCVSAVVLGLSESASIPVRCQCSMEYRPICGSDNITYTNECFFECERKNSLLEFNHYGACARIRGSSSSNVGSADCYCPMIFSPVCGSNGHTYDNFCSFNCDRITNPTLQISYQGECRQTNYEWFI